MAADPTATYRAQQGMAKITQSYDPKVVAMIVKAAKATGADPKALLATAIQESGARFGAVGDKGTSFGPFQMHRGGALGSHDVAWANSYGAVLNRAQEFVKGGVHHGKGAAAVQRPQDQSLYAKGVDSHAAQAAAILAKAGGLPLPSGATATTQVPGKQVAQSAPPQAGQVTPFGLTPGDLLASAKQHLGMTQAKSGVSYIEQALGASKQPTPMGAPLPSGGFSSVPVNKLKFATDVGDSTALSPSGKGIVQAALKFKGTPYSWGGGGTSGPSKGIAQGAKITGFDCSGLVQYAVFQATGQKIARMASAQLAGAKPVSLKNAKPGDVIGFGTKTNVHHIGIYLGDGKFIESPHTGDVVKISNLSGRKDVVGIGRY